MTSVTTNPNRYEPEPPPEGGGAEELRAYIIQELSRLSALVNMLADGHIEKTYVEPSKLIDGMLRYADGTSWNPGYGKGPYIRLDSLWVPMTQVGLGWDGSIINGKIVESHASNAVTYTLKGADGNDLSADNRARIRFPSATLTDSGYDEVEVTANISVTVSSGSTLGHASAKVQHHFLGALKTGAVAELFVTNLPPDYPAVFRDQRLISTTAEGGGGGADSATGIYSTTARSNVPWIPVAKIRGLQTVAGTWAADPHEVSMWPYQLSRCFVHAYRDSSVQTITDNTLTKAQLNAEVFDADGVFDNVTNFRYQPHLAGPYRLMGSVDFVGLVDQSDIAAFLYKTGTLVHQSQYRTSGAATEISDVHGLSLMNGTTDYFELQLLQNSGASQSLQTGSPKTFLIAERVGGWL